MHAITQRPIDWSCRDEWWRSAWRASDVRVMRQCCTNYLIRSHDEDACTGVGEAHAGLDGGTRRYGNRRVDAASRQQLTLQATNIDVLSIMVHVRVHAVYVEATWQVHVHVVTDPVHVQGRCYRHTTGGRGHVTHVRVLVWIQWMSEWVTHDDAADTGT